MKGTLHPISSTLQFLTLPPSLSTHPSPGKSYCELSSSVSSPAPRRQVQSQHPKLSLKSHDSGNCDLPRLPFPSQHSHFQAWRRRVCACVCKYVSLCVCMCVYGRGCINGDIINESWRAELKRNWSIVKQIGINNPLDVICGLSGGAGGAETPPPFFFLSFASTPSIWSGGEAAPE